MDKTKIDWADSTWSPITGCLHDCEYCYARGIANRFGGNGKAWSDNKIEVLNEPLFDDMTYNKLAYPFKFRPTFYRYRLNEYQCKKGRNIFVCSMADLFGDWVPDSWIEEVFAACKAAPQHNYLFLTKNPQRYVDLGHAGKLPCSENMWYGSTVTDPTTGAYWGDGYKTFWSIEPILSSFATKTVKRELPGWIIVGAETGRRRNKVIPDRWWIEEIVDVCKENEIPLFMKSSLEKIWLDPLIQEFPAQLKHKA